MKPLLIPLVILFATPALAVPPVPIEFQTIADLDSFRITITSPTADTIRLIISPRSVQVGSFVESHPNEMDVSRMVSRPTEDFTWWSVVGGWTRDRWTEWQWTQAPATLNIIFGDVVQGQLVTGQIIAPLENGTFTGWTVPEPGAWVLAIGAMACVVAWKRRALASRGA